MVTGAGWKRRAKCIALACGSLIAAAPTWGQTTASWLLPVNGTWTDATKWSTNPVYPKNGSPSGTTYNAVLGAVGAAYDVIVNAPTGVTTIDLGSADTRIVLLDSAYLSADAITGTGEIILNEPHFGVIVDVRSSFSSLTIGSGIAIRSSPVSGSTDNVGWVGTVVNYGLISAQTAGHTIASTGTFNNWGQIGAADGGTLRFSNFRGDLGSVTLETGGVIELNGNYVNQQPRSIADGCHLSLSGVWSNLGEITVSNATLSLGGTPGSIGSVSLINSELRVTGQLSTAQILSTSRTNSVVSVSYPGELNNTGNSIVIDPAASTWKLSGGTITGGSITSSGGTPLRVEGGGTLNGVDLQCKLVLESGLLGLRGAWQNNGTIVMNDGTLRVGSTTSTAGLGKIIRNGGSLSLATTLDNTGAVFDLATNDWGTLWMQGGRIIGGVVKGGPGTGIELADPSGIASVGTFEGVNVQTPVHVVGASLRFKGDLELNDTILIERSVATGLTSGLTFFGANIVNGNGTIIVNSAPPTGLQQIFSSATLTFGNGIYVGAKDGSATISALLLNNQGTISASTPNSRVDIRGILNNSGLIEARGGASITMNSATLSNLSGNVLTGGRWAVYSNGSMLLGTPTITASDADILLDGPDSSFAAITPLHTNLGRFAIDHGRNFTTVGSLSTSGFLGIGTNSTLYVSGVLNNTGSIDLIGTIIVNYNPGEAESAVFDSLVGQIGSQIFTSQVDPAKGIGSAENSELGYITFHGQPVDATSVLLMLTYFGDANLDGVADLADYDMWLAGYAPAEATPGWINGDFDYNGAVNLTDFELYLHGYYALGGSMEAISSAVKSSGLPESDQDAMLGLIATVPEPIGFALVGLLLPWSLKRPRRH